MKKLLSILLALVMVFSLAVPAFADRPAPENHSSDWNYEQEQAKKDFITSHGGVPGQLNVMVNGKCLTFPAGKPVYAEQGVTYVDAATLSKALGVEVTANDKGYAALRTAAEAAGCQVWWDGDYATAVVLNPTALAAQIDKDFTIYNKLLAQNVLNDKAQKSVGSTKADITLFDTLNGDKNAKATCSYDLTASKTGAAGKVAYDFSQLWDILAGYIPMPLDLAGAEDHAQNLELLKSLMKGEAELRMDLEKEMLYFSMPGLFEAMGSYLAASGIQIPKNSWLSLSLKDMDLNQVTALTEKTPTMGSVLCAVSASAAGYDPIHIYDTLMEAAQITASLIGDSKFTREGDAIKLSVTLDDLLGLVDDENKDSLKDLMSQYDLAMTVKDNGDIDASFQARMSLGNAGINLGDTVDISARSSRKGDKSQGTVELQVQNMLKVTVEMEETVTEADQTVEFTPSKDALVLPMDGMTGGSISSPDGPNLMLP